MPTPYEYEKPQVKVYQSFTEVPTETVGTQPAFIFGPAYTLYRYDYEPELCRVSTAYTGEAYNSDLPNGSGAADTGWDGTAAYLEDAVATLAGKTVTYTVPTASSRDYVTISSEYDVDPEAQYLKVSAGGDDLKVGDYIGAVSSGIVVLAKYPNIGTDSDVAAWFVRVGTAVVSGASSQAINFYVDVAKVAVSAITASSFSIAASAGITTDRGAATISSAARVYIQYREPDYAPTKAIDHINQIGDVGSVGQVDPANPLAYGVYMAKLNSGGCPVYYMGTKGTDKESFLDVLRAVSLTEDIYQLVPMTQDSEILDAVEAHVNEMSTPEMKRWRIGWASAVIDDYSWVTELASKVLNTSVGDVPTKYPTFADTTVKAIDLLSPGDEITFSDDSTTTIVRVVNNTKIEIPAAISTTDGTKTIKQVKHYYTGTQYAELVADKSRSFSDRRIYNTFPSTLHLTIDGNEVDAPGYYGAAGAAGLCSSTLPQQPLTNMDINGISDVPETYQKFDNYELNIMAAGGTFIIAQDLPYDRVYVRHQLSTATYEGNLLTRELSITKNVDSISYYLSETCEDLIGKYNITPELLRVVELRLRTAIDWLENNTDNGLYGPQLLEEGTEILSVAEHPVLKDHVQAYIVLNPPKPFNVLEIHLTVI